MDVELSPQYLDQNGLEGIREKVKSFVITVVLYLESADIFQSFPANLLVFECLNEFQIPQVGCFEFSIK